MSGPYSNQNQIADLPAGCQIKSGIPGAPDCLVTLSGLNPNSAYAQDAFAVFEVANCFAPGSPEWNFLVANNMQANGEALFFSPMFPAICYQMRTGNPYYVDATKGIPGTYSMASRFGRATVAQATAYVKTWNEPIAPVINVPFGK